MRGQFWIFGIGNINKNNNKQDSNISQQHLTEHRLKHSKHKLEPDKPPEYKYRTINTDTYEMMRREQMIGEGQMGIREQNRKDIGDDKER